MSLGVFSFYIEIKKLKHILLSQLFFQYQLINHFLSFQTNS